jgi:hypothetical protein
MTGPNADIGTLATYIPQVPRAWHSSAAGPPPWIRTTRASSAMRGITGGATLDPPDAAAAAPA